MKGFLKNAALNLTVIVTLYLSTKPFLESAQGEPLDSSRVYLMNNSTLFSINHPLFWFLVFSVLGAVLITHESNKNLSIGKGLYAIGFIGYTISFYEFYQRFSSSISTEVYTLSNNGTVLIITLSIGILYSLYLLFDRVFMASVYYIQGRSFKGNPFSALNNPFELLKEWLELVESGALSKSEYEQLKKYALTALVDSKQAVMTKIELLKQAYKDNLITETDVEKYRVDVLKIINITQF